MLRQKIKNFFRIVKIKVFLKIFFSLVGLNFLLLVLFSFLRYQQLNEGIFFLIIFLVLISISFFSFLISQKFAFSIEKLKWALKELKEGNPKIRVYFESKDELGELAFLFNQIAKEFQDNQLMVEQTKKFVDLKVRARTKELEEIIENLKREIKEKMFEIQKKNAEFEDFQKLTIDREKRMIELKEEIKKLKKELKELGKEEK